MLRTEAGQTDSLFDLVLPEPLRELPADLAAIDELLRDDAMLAPFREHWDREVKAGLIGSSRWGRPTIPMATCVRLMVLKHRYRWGYEVLVREVADSLDLRRFCIRYPTDINLVGDAVRTLVRVAGRTIEMVPGVTARVRDRGRAIGKRIREPGRTLQRRTVEARSEVMRLTTGSARLLQATLREARQLLVQSLHQVRTMVEQPTRAQVRAVVELAQFAARAEQVAEQVRRRFAGEPVTDRLVSIFDIRARPIREGKLGVPTQFGYLLQLTVLTPTTRQHGARGLLLPPTFRVGNPHENMLLPDTVTEVGKVDASPDVAAFDGGFTINATRTAMADIGSEVFIVGSKKNAGSRHHQRRLARYGRTRGIMRRLSLQEAGQQGPVETLTTSFAPAGC